PRPGCRSPRTKPTRREPTRVDSQGDHDPWSPAFLFRPNVRKRALEPFSKGPVAFAVINSTSGRSIWITDGLFTANKAGNRASRRRGLDLEMQSLDRLV